MISSYGVNEPITNRARLTVIIRYVTKLIIVRGNLRSDREIVVRMVCRSCSVVRRENRDMRKLRRSVNPTIRRISGKARVIIRAIRTSRVIRQRVLIVRKITIRITRSTPITIIIVGPMIRITGIATLITARSPSRPTITG